MMVARRKKIWWSEDERDLVKERLVEILKENPKIKKGTAFKEAQKILSDDRHRTLGTQVLSKGKDNEIWLMAHREVKGVIAKEEAAKKAPEEPIYIPVPSPLDLDSIPTHELLSHAILRLMTMLAPKASEPVRVTVTPPQGWVAPAHSDRPRPPRVGVIGLMKDQFNHLKARVNQKKAELVFIDKDHKPGTFPTSLDYVVVQRHVSHSHYDNIKAAFGSDRVAFSSGGISETSNQLEAFIPGCLN